jgi:ribitol-5-phosphate 2-dehydrogenase (NADP+) / D-ribitol-5-phosphate cytidylyltransferase
MYKNKYISAVLLMGGSGKRFGGTLPKQFIPLKGFPIYVHTLKFFISKPFIDEIILVCHKDWIQKINLNDHFSKDLIEKVNIVPGGKTRQESSYQGILSCKYRDIVIIHDIARPFVTNTILIDNIEKAITHKAVNTCIDSTDTLIHTKDTKTIHSIPDRSQYLRCQTPQTFSYDLIREAHDNALLKELSHITDDCKLIIDNNQCVFIVKGDEKNIKITTEIDLLIAEQILNNI